MRVRPLVAVSLAAAALLLAGCSQGDQTVEEATPSATASSAAPVEEAPSAMPTVDAEVAEKLDSSDGQIIVPGSIESVKQDLGPECTTAVAPVREFIAEYPSGFSLTIEQKSEMVKVLNKARSECEVVSAQEWTNFYAGEFAGWLYEKVE